MKLQDRVFEYSLQYADYMSNIQIQLYNYFAIIASDS